ncbi:MAG: hypothetical protein CMB35_00840 [Euryarchaeota archaeon]|nr:hypothetical protein [Euryarchaeota archaeon]
MSARTVALLFSLILLLPGCLGSGEEGVVLLGTEYKDPPEAPDFTLKNQYGESVSLSEYGGRIIVVAFIYTSCPDVCLVISSKLHYVNQNLGGYDDNVEILSVTIDPARDTTSHLSEWTQTMGFEWGHLTHERGSVMQTVWDDWNVVVDASHIANSLPPEGAHNRFTVLFPDNSTLKIDYPYEQLPTGAKADEFARLAFERDNTTMDMGIGVIGNFTANSSWSWELHRWESSEQVWTMEQSSLSEISMTGFNHFAWVASGSNISLLPPGEDCMGHGWIMGSGANAHCMCNDGWERDGDDWLTCVSEGGQSNGTDPHEKSLGEYEVGHSTVTFIIDKQQRKRVAYSGINWDADDFLQDVKALADE